MNDLRVGKLARFVVLVASAGCAGGGGGDDAGARPPGLDAAGVDGGAPAGDAVTPSDTGADGAAPADGALCQTGRPASSDLGAECTAAANFGRGSCGAGEACALSLGPERDFEGGYCTVSCESRACPAGSSCRGEPQRMLCLATCCDDGDCRAGYACVTGGGADRVCVPAGDPLGRRSDGSACYTAGSDGAHPLAPLARATFRAGDLAVSAGRTDAVTAAEGNVVHAPRGRGVAVIYMGFDGRGNRFAATSRSADDGASFAPGPALRGAGDPWAGDPVLAYGPSGRLFAAFTSTQLAPTTAYHVNVATSDDDGGAFAAPRAIEPPGFCAEFCDKPWIVAGRHPTDPARRSVYVGYLRYESLAAQTSSLVVQRSDDDGVTFGAPVAFVPTDREGHFTHTLALGDDGALHVAWLASDGVDAQVRYARSADGGATFSPTRVVSAPTDHPADDQPVVAVDGATVYVAYVATRADQATHIGLATSADGGVTFSRRKVNDEPDTCATHSFPALVADPVRHRAHLVWLENRFGPGAVVYASCPMDPAAPCAPNEAVSTAPFLLTNSRDWNIWHGDYIGLALAGDTLWAAWSDNRTGGPVMYVATGTLAR